MLTSVNGATGGPGFTAPYPRDTFILEANTHVQLPFGLVVEPAVQYAINPNSYYDPDTARKARSGFWVGATVIIPIGTILGLGKLS